MAAGEGQGSSKEELLSVEVEPYRDNIATTRDMTASLCGYGKDELFIAEELPKHLEIECPVCLQVMLTDPHLVTCCGHHFCGDCIDRVQASNGPCPVCKEKNYQAFVDKNTLRIINGLQVYCTNKSEEEENGCQWKGDLKNLSTHLSKGKREGECQFEEVKCQYEICREKNQRRHLVQHENNYCLYRPQCQYCGFIGVTEAHYKVCTKYPLSCPNMCQDSLPRSSLDTHLSNECPLQPVECPFSWAGCTHKPLRKDSHSHTTDPNHMSLLAVACGQLKKENETLNIMCGQLNVACGQLRIENEKFKKEKNEFKEQVQKVYNALTDNYSVLPVTIQLEFQPVHAYTHMFGHYISVKYKDNIDHGIVYLAFHEGKFDKLQPELPKISVKYHDKLLPLVKDTTVVKKMEHHILDKYKPPLGVLNALVTCWPVPPQVEIVIS